MAGEAQPAGGRPVTRRRLETLYKRYNRREFVSPDPLELLYEFDDEGDREVVALIASSLAFGRVEQILVSTRRVLAAMGPSPRSFVLDARRRGLSRAFYDFRHRFVGGEDVVALVLGIKRALDLYGSLNECFLEGYGQEQATLVPALTAFVAELTGAPHCACGYLLPRPEKGSACKRLNLFLRWMVRFDAVDPGGWSGVTPAELIVPLDVHMHRVAVAMGLTARGQANMRTALEVTEAFRRFAPEDPVKYDFALTRFGIRGDLPLAELAGD